MTNDKHWFKFNRFNKLTFAAVSLFLSSFFIVSFSWNGLLTTIFMYVVTIGFGVSITFHRYLTHSSFNMHPLLQILGKFFGSMAGTGSPIMWVQIHRSHHIHSDKDGDPHPPKHIVRTLSGSYPDVEKNGLRKFAGDKISIFLHRNYFMVLYFYALCWLVLGGVDMLFYGFLYPVIMAISFSNLLNVMAHTKSIGYRTFSTSDNSANNPLMALLVFGEGWHNNHHRFPGNVNFRQKWWEFDIGYMIIYILSLCGLTSLKNNGKY
jgi:fatty-acid desaturase